MASEIIETVLRFRAEGDALKRIAAEAGAASSALGKVAAVAGTLSAGIGLTVGFAVALGRMTTEAAKTADEMERLGLATAAQTRSLKENAAAWKVTTLAWDSLKLSILSSKGTYDFFTGLTAVALIAQGHIGDLRQEIARLKEESRVQSATVTSSVTQEFMISPGVYMTAAEMEKQAAADEAAGRAFTARQDARRTAAAAAAATARAAELARGEALRTARLFQSAQGFSMQEFESTLGPDGLPLGHADGVDTGGKDKSGLDGLKNAHATTTDQLQRMWMQTASVIGGALSSLSGLFAKNAAAQKVLALAGIAFNTGLAVSQALASPPGPPYTIPLAIAVGAMGAVQFAAAAAGRIASVGGGGASFGGSSLGATAGGYTPSSQSGEGRVGGGGGSARGGSREITLHTVAGYAPVRDLVEAINAHTGGRGMRLRLAGP